MTRIRTLEFLPSIFQTPTNSQFLAATLDQLVNPPVTKKIQGYVGSKFGYGINANDYYVTEPTKVRTDYQLEPGITFLKNNENVAKDFISYPGLLDALKLQGGITTDNSKLFNSQFYSWDSFTNLDMIINYNQYYWLPEGPPAVIVASDTVFLNNEYIVESLPNTYNIRAVGAGAGADNPTITLIRGGTYNFYVDQDTQFWIQGEPGVSGYSPTQTNLYVRDVYGVDNNGATNGIVTFNVPFKDAQDSFNYPGNNPVGVVSTRPFSQINGAKLSEINNIDGVTSLNGRTVMFYNTGIDNEIGYVSNFFSEGTYDTNYANLVAPITTTATAINLSGEITLSNVANLEIGTSITFTGTSFGNINTYSPFFFPEVSSSTMVAGLQYFITELGNTNWISAGVTSNGTINGEINGNLLTVETILSGAFNIGMTLVGPGITSGTTITGYDAETTALTGKYTYFVSISQNVPNTNIDLYDLQDGKIFTATGPLAGTGKVRRYNPVIYYVKTINPINNTITISELLDGPTLTPSVSSTGTLTVSINQGLYEEGFYVNVNDYFFTITYLGDINDPVIKLTPAIGGLIPTEQKITPQFGTQYIGLNFFKNQDGFIEQYPYISAPLDTLYYQDGTNPNKVGTIRLIESNALNTLNVNTQILGKKNFTSTNGVIFTNGLKVEFDGDVIPTSYLSGQYYVQGVGTSIELIPVDSLVVPESFTTQTSLPYDTTNFDIGNFDAALFIPENQDYITIARNSINKNAWSRSNRWFHSDVIKATSEYNDDPNILTTYGNAEFKAKRPIIEFYPNLKLFNSGTVAKASVDFVDTRTTDAFSAVAGQAAYYPDVETYTNYSSLATINASPTVTQGQFLVGQQYRITNINTTAPAAWLALGVKVFVEGEFVPGIEYVITYLGDPLTPVQNQLSWNQIAGTTGVIYTVGSIFTAAYSGEIVGSGGGQAAETLFTAQSTGVINSSEFITGLEYTITELGTTLWNNISTIGTRSWGAGDPVVGGTFIATAAGVGTGYATQGDGTALSLTATTITIPASEVVGNLTVGMYINDQIRYNQSQLPANTRILSIEGTSTYTITVFYPLPTIIPGSASLIVPPAFTIPEISFVANSKNNSDLLLFAGARIVFLNESNPITKNKIYVANFSTTVSGLYPLITLTEALDGDILANDQFAVLRGENYQGTSFYYDGINFIQAQQKVTINQPPKFDVYDKNGISFGNEEFYESTTFTGCDLLRYKPGVGVNDTVLGFPISYSSINNVGDITFEVALNVDTFNYVTGTQQNVTETQKVNTGYVYNVTSRTEFERLIGWQTAVAPSTQYQIFEFEYTPDPTIEFDVGDTIFYTVNCDVAQLNVSDTVWPSIEVYNNNNILIENQNYTVENGSNFTNVTVQIPGLVETVIQVAILSNQTSQNAYYSIPINLSNNPFNTDVTSVDIGDIRGHYQSIFYNNPDTTGDVFGANNTRDLGNIVPWGNRIIQNSASLVLPGAFLRQAEHSLFDSLMFNSREYIKFKTLLIDTANKIDWQQRFNPSALLDEALDQITSVKNQEMPFFWSDMIPNKAAYITNTYTFFNNIDTTTFPLSKIYNFNTANYDGVLVYLQTVIQGTTITQQLIKNIDYTISTDSPSLIVTKDLNNGDKIIIKEYNQTYGSYVPNTPTKLGLYPATIPSVVLDSSYAQPTYFIVGHDGSYTKLYGTYDPNIGLIDYRDQVLLEYETRVYNNLKLSNTIPIQAADILPGYFRGSTINYDEWLSVYSSAFLDWVGQNRLDYKTQLYLATNEYTYNYTNSRDKLNKTLIQQGNWRGMYLYYFDTSTPNSTPWQMIGYANKPDWWETRYGPAPYTSDNLILWQDMENGIDWNNGNPIEIEIYKRPGLLSILPVDDQGNLINPLTAVVGNYNPNTFQRDWTIGDVGPVEFSYRRSSTWPYDLMRLQALLKPANFFNLGVDIDNYKYNAEFNQFLIDDRNHLVPSNVEIYGNGTPKTSYINWIVDYEKQLGVDATTNIKNLLNNLDVRLVYRLAGFSDKTLLKFFVEKGTPGSKNASLLIPDESYQVLLYENQPYDKLTYSSVIVQQTTEGYKVFGNSQTTNYFKTFVPIINSNTKTITVEDQSVKVAGDYSSTIKLVPYGTLFYTPQEVSQFLMSYGSYLESAGAKFEIIESGVEINWEQMVAEFLYWTQVGWSIGSIVTLNPSANTLVIDKDSQIVQPLTFQQTNFVLNQNLYPIETKDLSILRNGTAFSVSALNPGDSIAYGQFNLSNLEHGIVFDNTTIFGDVVYNLISGLKQNRIFVQGTKSAEWNGTMFASGFIYNQDNIEEWRENVKYTKGAIVKFKNKYFTALTIVQPNKEFKETEWKETDYNEIQKGLLPNSSTRSYESALYYNTNEANLEDDGDQLAFSLIGFRSRPYMASADLTDITQVNVYKNFIKEKGTRAALSVFKGAQLPQGGIDYNIYENWAIMSGTFGGVLNNNFIEFKLNQNELTGNPGIVGLTTGQNVLGAQQIVPLYSITNYGQPISDANVLPTISEYTPSAVFPDAGYVNFNDVKMSAYFFEQLSVGVDQNGIIVPINDFYIGDYVWIANYLAKWQVMTPSVIAQVVQANANLNGTTTITFDKPHNLNQFDIFAVINFDNSVNGYYVATQIVNPYQVIVPLILSNGIRTITGQGIAYNFSSQRVVQPSDIQNLNLLPKEFVQNTVWVDQNNDGGWAVYRKGINYKYDTEFSIENSVTFGSSVAFTSKGDYLFGDAGTGNVYRFQYDALNKVYEQDQTITNDISFGTNIAYAQNVYAISQATVDPTIYFYYVNDTTITDDIIPFNTNTNIIAPIGATNFGTGLAMSGDANWLYVGDYDTNSLNIRNKVHAYRRNNTVVTAPNLQAQKTYQIKELGTTDFTTLGAIENKVGIYFTATGGGLGTGTAINIDYEFVTTLESPEVTADKFGSVIATNYYGDVVVVGAPEYDYDVNTENWGKSYVFNRMIQNFEVQNNSTSTPATFTLAFTPTGSEDPIIYRNGTEVSDTNYSIVGTSLIYTGTLKAGDILEVNSCNFDLVQTLTTETNPRIGVMFGTGLDTNKFGNEILVGAPFALDSTNQEGAVYRFTNAGARFGIVIGTEDVNVTTNRDLLINGFLVTIPPGDSDLAALTINQAKITNVEAVSANGKLIISVIDQSLATQNEKLLLNVTDTDTLLELGLTLYTQTQVLQCPHLTGPTQFGYTVAFNESNSVVISAPSGTRYAQTTFDFVDDDNYSNDLVFDNNATQFIDSYPNAGAVYMYDYLANFEENLNNIGAYTYAQSCNAQDQIYGSQPYYGRVLDFNENKVIIGTPNYRPDDIDGQVVVYVNELGFPNWSVYRQTNPIVDINRIQNIQIYNSENNQTLINMDYFDPLQGKLLGAIRQNIDTISNTDPATYNNDTNTQSGFVWGAEQTGTIWLDTTNLRFVNYHQNDNVYNSKYWGTLFPGSDVAVYTWVGSNVLPTEYQGPGTPKDVNSYTVQTIINSSNTIQPIYYFWVRNSGLILGNKTLADVNIAAYIANPLGSGITYFAPVNTNVYSLYNSQQYINAKESVLHIGYSNGQNDDPSHQSYQLIREDFASDFLPGFVNPSKGIFTPQGLYDRMLDSLAGVDEEGGVLPDPFLPKLVQTGVLARPRQSFFYDRYKALQNYLQYANTILSLFPIAELRPLISFLNEKGDYYDTTLYWERINWWAPGYDNNTKAAIQVQFYADLSTLNVSVGTIVAVNQNSQGFTEYYRYDENSVWTRIGLQNGTIRFKTELWNYDLGQTGYGDDFYGTTPYDQYPSEETRWIIRALNEQIYTNDLLIYRNKSLILLFEYIQSETVENQNYLPWLNKTSLVDVSHKIRELIPLQNFKSDNQEFLSGYVNEVKPYHVVIKEFLFEYTGEDIYQGNITDFDLPATYDTSTQSFISPQLVYSNPNLESDFLPDDPIWELPQYTEWRNNYGVSIVGQDNYLITKTDSYLPIGATFLIVDNAQGFPINGTIKIADVENPTRFEIIGYSSVDTSTNTLFGLTRGLNGTTEYDHIPGENVFIDLPPVVVLDGGRGYSNPPRVFAQIDLTKYPAPKEEAVLEAVMSLDSVVGINVINPGIGYAVLPNIIIDPAATFTFTSDSVTAIESTIELYAPALQTGDLIRYVKVSGENIGGLENNQYYYINVLSNSPLTILALYANYSDALKDQNRVEIYSQGTGSNHKFELGAKASAVSSSYPIRENNITLRFDRTTYDSQITDWVPGSFYGAFFAGSYNNTENISSSSIELQSTLPPIDTILASNDGLVLPLVEVGNERVLDWSEFERSIANTSSTNNIITLNVDFSTENASGSTIGFTVGMPIKFIGTAGTSLIVSGDTYYIDEIISDTQFKISATQYGPTYAVGDSSSATDLKAFTAQVVDTALITTYYPGIRNVTATNSTNSIVTIPLTDIGTGGTAGLYTGIPIVFTGSVFGGIEEHVVYFVNSVLDKENFTISATDEFIRIKALSINAANQIIVQNTTGLNVNDRIVFSNMTIYGDTVTNWGNIIQGTIYYVKTIDVNVITISETLGGVEKLLAPITSDSQTYCFFVDQETNFALTTANGNMTVNIQLPASPGQINGQLFTFYPTSSQYVNITATNYSNLIQRTIEYASASGNLITLTNNSGGTNSMYIGMPITVDENIGGLIANTTYTIEEIDEIQLAITNSSASNNTFTVDGSVDVLYVDMPVVFSGNPLGSIIIGVTYYVDSIDTINNKFTIKDSLTGTTIALTTNNGSMVATGPDYVKLDTTITSDEYGPVTLNQKITVNPVFDVSYILGGYKVLISNQGAGLTVNNIITIPGTQLGGTSPKNDLTLKVNKIDSIVSGTYSWSLPIESNGNIENVICSGKPNASTNNYYLKVISANQFKVYSDPRMTIPVSGLTLGYEGATITSATNVELNGVVTLSDVSNYNINDSVVFTGTVFGNIQLGQIYYITSINTLDSKITISQEPGGSPLVTSEETGSMTIASRGSYMFLPEPFYFNQSIVKYNNRVYICVVSNNDDQFVFGKWEELNSGDRRLNAMDRVKGYYQPTINMPGTDLNQLFAGVTYPNTIYKGNAFDPADQYEVDTLLQDQVFYPENVNITGIAWDGVNYIAPANTPNYTALAKDIEVTDDWLLGRLSNKSLGITDIVKSDNLFVMTSNNSATPILTSIDGAGWSTNGFFVPFGVEDNELEFERKLLIQSKLTFNKITYGNGKYIAVGQNICTSDSAVNWIETYKFDTGFTGYIYDVAYVTTTSFNGFIAVGTRNNTKFVLRSLDGENWTQVTAFNNTGSTGPQRNATLKTVTSNNDVIILAGDLGVIYRSIPGGFAFQGAYGALNSWVDSEFAQNTFALISNTGKLLTSANGLTWTEKLTGTTESLNSIYYNSDKNEWTIAGNNNTLFQTSDITSDPVVWDKTQLFSIPDPAYTIKGDSFMSGYGPEELVPGVVSDQLTMIVTTRPGTNWSATEYAHVGYNVVSVELDYDNNNEYSFADVVAVPAGITVYAMIDGLATTIYSNDYSVDYVNKIVTLNTNILNIEKLRIDVYEVGNGDQLVKSNTQIDPLRDNNTTGFQEILLNCNYTAERLNGGGIIRPTTDPAATEAISTDSLLNTITVNDVSIFTLNDDVYFTGEVFGGLSENIPYYVKTIDTIQKTITVSASINDGIAGPIYDLTTDSGSNMTVIAQNGPGLYWTPPAVFYNGNKLINGETNLVIRSKASDNSLITFSTVGLIPNQKIIFDNQIFGGLEPHKTYYIKDILSGGTQFTVSETVGGPVVILTNALGKSNFITEDYAVMLADNQVSAKVVFADEYDTTVDYISFSFFGETVPTQYGYTLPQTQTLLGNGTRGNYTLTNYLGEDNDTNAIVEVNGLRIMPDQYTINYNQEVLVFDTLEPTINDTIAVTTFNDTQRQYLNTQYELSPINVNSINNVYNVISQPILDTQTASAVGGYFIASSTTNMVVGQSIFFQIDIPGSSPVYTGFGGVATDGTQYIVSEVTIGNKFKVVDENGTVYPTTNDTGLMHILVGGQPAVRVQTNAPHILSNNDLVRIDGILGSIQLNNNLFYVHVINSEQFDLYQYFPDNPEENYSPYLDAVNHPITICDSYISGGYVWIARTWILENTIVTSCDSSELTVGNVLPLVLNTPVYFTENDIALGKPTGIPQIIAGERYYIRSIDYDNNKITISETANGNIISFAPQISTNIALTQWEQTNVDRLWVTVNGERVASSSLKLNAGNEVSILVPIQINDEIIITSMMPSATPNEMVYVNTVDKNNQGVVYRANNDSRTWLSQALTEYQNIVYVNDINNLTFRSEQTNTAPAKELGYYYIPLNADKNDIIDVSVYNNTTGRIGYIEEDFLQLEVKSTGPYIRIQEGDWIEEGDSLSITVYEGKLIYIQGEYMRVLSVDQFTNTMEVERGANGSGIQVYIPKYAEVYSFLDKNTMTNINYNDTWNKIPGLYNTSEGDPLQLAIGSAAEFLRMDE